MKLSQFIYYLTIGITGSTLLIQADAYTDRLVRITNAIANEYDTTGSRILKI